MMKELTIKNTIDQAEKLREKEIYAWIGSFIDGGEDMDAYWQNSLKELFNSHISTYTKDLLQSVESKLDVLDTCLEGLPMAGDGLITQKLYASDVVERLKEVKADIISKL